MESKSSSCEGRLSEREDPRFPTHVQIQTVTSCATLCHFCPNATLPLKPRRSMTTELFSRLCGELSSSPPRHAALYLMADPLTDPLIFSRAVEFRDACPDTWVELSTKGELLGQNVRRRLLDAPINELRITFPTIDPNEYGQHAVGADFPHALENVTALATEWEERGRPFMLDVVVLSGWVSPESIKASAQFWGQHGVGVSTWPAISRAGNVPAIHGIHHTRLHGCSQGRATHWLHISWDGRALLCCMDYTQTVVIGDVASQGIAAVWNSDRYAEIRAMVRGDQPADASFPCFACEWNGAWNGRRQAVEPSA